jgi:hypothetical protein
MAAPSPVNSQVSESSPVSPRVSRAGARSSRPMIQAFVFAAVALYALVGMIAA